MRYSICVLQLAAVLFVIAKLSSAPGPLLWKFCKWNIIDV